MKIVPDLYRSVNNALSRQSRLARSLSTQSTKDSFERRVLGGDGLSSKSSDGMDSMLEKAAEEDFSFRDNMLAKENLFGTTYRAPGGTDLRRQASRPYSGKKEFETTTEEVLRNADFRNVRFLANFITEAGLIIKRSQTNISAKAQRKVAREIKTARVLGLMPFVTMGTKPFVFGQSMNDRDGDYQI